MQRKEVTTNDYHYKDNNIDMLSLDRTCAQEPEIEVPEESHHHQKGVDVMLSKTNYNTDRTCIHCRINVGTNTRRSYQSTEFRRIHDAKNINCGQFFSIECRSVENIMSEA